MEQVIVGVLTLMTAVVTGAFAYLNRRKLAKESERRQREEDRQAAIAKEIERQVSEVNRAVNTVPRGTPPLVEIAHELFRQVMEMREDIGEINEGQLRISHELDHHKQMHESAGFMAADDIRSTIADATRRWWPSRRRL